MTVIILLVAVVVLLPVLLVVVIVAAARRRPGEAILPGASLRRFFQYLLAYGLVLTVAIAASIVVSMADAGLAPMDRSAFAGALTAAIVGAALLAGVGWWIASDLRRHPAERATFGWRCYLALTSLTALAVAAVGAALALTAALRGELDGTALGIAVVWATVWGAHRMIERLTVPVEGRAGHLFLGSLAGLVTTVVGLVLTLGELGRELFSEVLVGGGAALPGSVSVLVVGFAVWCGHWLVRYRRAGRRPAWLTLVLPVGVGGGTVLAVVGATRALYQVITWYLGVPTEPVASGHFASAPFALAAAVTGVGLVAYHRAVLGDGPVAPEVARVHRYLVAGVALGAAAVGVGMLVSAAVGTLLPAAMVRLGPNTLIAAATMLTVAGPLWWAYWRRIARAFAADPAAELASPTRKGYLVVLFGVVAVVAAGAILVAATSFVLGLVEGASVGAALGQTRTALGVLVAAGAVAWYHGMVLRTDRALLARVVPPADGWEPPADGSAPPASGPVPAWATVVLLGPPDPALVDAVATATGARVESWATPVTAAPGWSPDSVLGALGAEPVTAGGTVVVVADGTGPRALAVVRP